MSVIKISELVNVTSLNTDDTFPVVSEGETRKANIQQIVDIVGQNISVLKVQKVNSIADVTEPNIIYLVPSNSKEGNLYDEYMLIDGGAEIIGAQEVNLSGYATTTDVEEMINDSIGGVLNGSY